MGFVKGSKHSAETRAKMSASRRGKPHSDDRKAKISASNAGKVRAKTFRKTCPCGVVFDTASHGAKFHSRECRRSFAGHGIVNSPRFSHFPRECAICTSREQLVGDHDHMTGRARGILCRNCNLAIGNMFDDPSRMRRAASYLERSLGQKALYLCGPMSGLPDSNYPAFHLHARLLRGLGYHVENPAENPPPPGRTWEGYMRMSIKQLVDCDGIATLSGWQQSRGATIEVELAESLEIPVASVDVWINAAAVTRAA